MAKKTVTARKRPATKIVGKMKSSILARIRKEVRKRRTSGGGDYYAKDPSTKPGGGYYKGDFAKSSGRRGSRVKPSQRKRPSKKKVAKKR